MLRELLEKSALPLDLGLEVDLRMALSKCLPELLAVVEQARMAVIGYPRYEMRPLREALAALREKEGT